MWGSDGSSRGGLDMTHTDLSAAIRDSAPEAVWIAGDATRIRQPTPMTTVRAPTGIRAFTPDEMTVVCGAGTKVDVLSQELFERGQYVNLPIRAGGSGTVGGALATGEGDVMRLGRGSVRDVLLQADFVDGQGTTIRAGGPTVKNVSGFDLCRLLVGSCGRVGFLSEVILRTRPLPMASQWFEIQEVGAEDISVIMREIPKPSSVLWDGQAVYLCLEGHPADIGEMTGHLGELLRRPVVERDAPDLSAYSHRWLRKPRDMADVVTAGAGRCIAEVATGVVHHCDPDDSTQPNPGVIEIENRILQAFDPSDRLNGGRKVWGAFHRRQVMAGA